jgi:hypothetical protein
MDKNPFDIPQDSEDWTFTPEDREVMYETTTKAINFLKNKTTRETVEEAYRQVSLEEAIDLCENPEKVPYGTPETRKALGEDVSSLTHSIYEVIDLVEKELATHLSPQNSNYTLGYLMTSTATKQVRKTAKILFDS